MKRLTLLAITLLLAVAAQAVPAWPRPVTVTQPDGSRLTIIMNGDEWQGFATTTDGYTVVSDNHGRFCYAQLSGESLAPTAFVAHEPHMRTNAERAFIANIPQRLTTDATRAQAARANAKIEAQKANLNPDRFRGLVILVEYSNRKFLFDNAREVFTDMIKKRGFDGLQNDSTGQWQAFTGSVRDYFRDNTAGRFDPEFDVVGPITAPYQQTFPNGSSNARALFSAVLNAANDSVDYSRYDADDDGVVDMVYFIVAGGGANMGNNSRYLWPHKWTFNYPPTLDGKTFNVYACSTELFDLEEDCVIDGIGTICHEFSHVLGVGDLYDADYAGSGGLSTHPGDWSIMAYGCYLNNSLTPAGYGLYERMSMGWANITRIDSERNYTLPPLQTSNTGYRINNSDKEFFLIENRQPIKWDQYLPGHGMLVWRVDSTSLTPYNNNRINANPSHNYFELVRAARIDTTVTESGKEYVVAVDSPRDPFPGQAGVHCLLNADTAPSIRSWAGNNSPFVLADIREQGQTIFFRATPDGQPTGLLGDINNDQMVNTSDLNLLINALLTNDNTLDRADLNGDSNITIADLNVMCTIILEK